MLRMSNYFSPLSFGIVMSFVCSACVSAPEFELLRNSVSDQDNSASDQDNDTSTRSFDPPVITEVDSPDDELDDEVAVCDPLDQQFLAADTSDRNGLVGQLSFLTENDPIAQSVYDFWAFDSETGEISALNQVNATLFSSWVNVPTRRFDSGFFTLGQADEALRRDDGQILIENFSIFYESNLVLGEAEAGRYEFAILSDDGAILRLWGAQSNGEDFVLDNDGNHPTRMACSNQAVEITENSLIPLELLYHQGPRYHISFIVMWRKLAENEAAGQDPSCGLSGNNVYFDYSTTPSTPKQAYLDLLDRGWQVIPTTSYLLPGDLTNPCSAD